MSPNAHGLKMIGLKAAAGATKQLTGYYSGVYEELFYDLITGKVWTKTQVGFGQNSWTEYHDPNVIKICNLSSPRTMQAISDKIATRIRNHAFTVEV